MNRMGDSGPEDEDDTGLGDDQIPIRRRVHLILNKSEADFLCLAEYDNYVERREDLIAQLNVDVNNAELNLILKTQQIEGMSEISARNLSADEDQSTRINQIVKSEGIFFEQLDYLLKTEKVKVSPSVNFEHPLNNVVGANETQKEAQDGDKKVARSRSDKLNRHCRAGGCPMDLWKRRVRSQFAVLNLNLKRKSPGHKPRVC